MVSISWENMNVSVIQMLRKKSKLNLISKEICMALEKSRKFQCSEDSLRS